MTHVFSCTILQVLYIVCRVFRYCRVIDSLNMINSFSPVSFRTQEFIFVLLVSTMLPETFIFFCLLCSSMINDERRMEIARWNEQWDRGMGYELTRLHIPPSIQGLPCHLYFSFYFSFSSFPGWLVHFPQQRTFNSFYISFVKLNFYITSAFPVTFHRHSIYSKIICDSKNSNKMNNRHTNVWTLFMSHKYFKKSFKYL